MIDLGTLHYVLGLQVLPLCDGFFISQYKYVMDLLTCFNIFDCTSCATYFHFGVKLTKACQTLTVDATLYQKLINNIIYLTHSRPDTSFDVSVVYKFIQDPKQSY
jgi:hypothetical protein